MTNWLRAQLSGKVPSCVRNYIFYNSYLEKVRFDIDSHSRSACQVT